MPSPPVAATAMTTRKWGSPPAAGSRCSDTERGIDVQRDPFTAIGIGMSGDVFGNGLLQSDTTCLVAAFNHLHIFVDPDPDAAQATPSVPVCSCCRASGWNDYDSKLISAGGGVFSRQAKSIEIILHARAIRLDADRMTPDELITALQRLWTWSGTEALART